MIKATINYSGTFVNKHSTYTITLSETDVAMEKKNETTGKFERLTVGDLYDAFANRNQYIQNASDPEEQLDSFLFEEWFKHKHLADKSFKDRIVNYTFQKI